MWYKENSEHRVAVYGFFCFMLTKRGDKSRDILAAKAVFFPTTAPAQWTNHSARYNSPSNMTSWIMSPHMHSTKSQIYMTLRDT